MATGKTAGIYTTITVNSLDMTASVSSVNGIGIDYETADVSTLAETIKESLLAQGAVSLGISGPFNNTASTGGHTVLSALVGSQTPVAALVKIGIRSAPMAGDPKFTCNVLLKNYMVSGDLSNLTYSATLVAGISNAAAWGTV